MINYRKRIINVFKRSRIDKCKRDLLFCDENWARYFSYQGNIMSLFI